MSQDRKQVVLKQSHKTLKNFLEKKSEALPRNFNQTRFLQNCMTVLQDTKKIGQMEPVSVARTMLKGAFLGLDFFNGECYAIPYGNSLNFQTDWKGERKLALKYSTEPIIDIYAKNVHENDEFSCGVKDGKQYLDHKEAGFEQGEIIGSYCVALYESGTIKYEKMSRKEIEDIRDNFSKAPNSKAWRFTFGEMCKKVVTRRLCKGIELNFENPEQDQAFEEGSGMEFEGSTGEIEDSPFNEDEQQDEPVDVDYEEVEEEEEQEEEPSDEEFADEISEKMEKQGMFEGDE
ncbi:MAG: recombinase RecT [Bacteroidota bacterium]